MAVYWNFEQIYFVSIWNKIDEVTCSMMQLLFYNDFATLNAVILLKPSVKWKWLFATFLKKYLLCQSCLSLKTWYRFKTSKFHVKGSNMKWNHIGFIEHTMNIEQKNISRRCMRSIDFISRRFTISIDFILDG